jgi:serine/threonine protein kinase
MTLPAKSADDSGSFDSLPPTAPPPVLAEPSVPARAGRYTAGAIVAGKYQLVSVLGEGGMGSVWVAKNRTLEVEVALKLMRAELAEEVEGVAERMLQEARAAASIGHPAIIQVFDFGFSEVGDPFIVMELLRGESLAEVLRRRGRLSPLRAAQTLLPIVDALAAAHARGIVHRDMKPENVFLCRLGGKRLQPKILDFGIAKLEQRAQERLTKDGAVIGSPAYMAPEQLRGEPGVDSRADIWALSVVLYQMLTGRRPFEGDSYHASMWNVLNAEPRPLREHGVEEAELWAILKRGLEKKASERFADVLSLGRELAAWLVARGVQEDITDASLKPWLETQASGAGHYSFFPSQEPSRRRPDEGNEETRATEGPRPQDAIESSGTRTIGGPFKRTPSANPFAPTVVRPRVSLGLPVARHWLWLTALSAVFAFVGAAVYAKWSAEPELDEESEAEASPRLRRVSPSPAARTKPEPRAQPAETKVSPSRFDDAPESEPEPAKVTPPRRAAPPQPAQKSLPRRAAPKSELKNPFG